MSRLRWRRNLPRVLGSLPWRHALHSSHVKIDGRVLHVGSDAYSVASMSAVHVDTLEPVERWHAWRQLRKMSIYPGLPIAALGIEFLRAGWTYALAGGMLLGLGALILSVGTGWYLYRVHRPATFHLVAVIAGRRRALFSSRDHDFVWSIRKKLAEAIDTATTPTTTTFNISGGRGFQFGNGNTQNNRF